MSDVTPDDLIEQYQERRKELKEIVDEIYDNLDKIKEDEKKIQAVLTCVQYNLAQIIQLYNAYSQAVSGNIEKGSN